jgi:hypothetical protein
MLEDSVLALINKDLDGLASADESARLREILAGNKEAQKFAEDLRGLARGLADVERAVPPATLRPAVMRSIAAASAGVQAGRGDSFLRNLLRVPGSLRPAMVFAGGVAAGLVLFALGRWVMVPGSLDENDLAGSLAVRGLEFSAGKALEFREGDMRASIRSGGGSGHAIVRVKLDVPSGTAVVLVYGQADGYVEALDVPKGQQAQVSLEQGRVVITGVSSGEVGILLGGKGEILAGVRLRLSDGRGGEWDIPLEGTPAH